MRATTTLILRDGAGRLLGVMECAEPPPPGRAMPFSAPDAPVMPLKGQPFKPLITRIRPNAAQLIPPSFGRFRTGFDMHALDLHSLGKRGE
jgi:hypothetical protein